MQSPIVHTLFELTNDIGATRAFYSDGLGLQETFYDEAQGWLTYQAGETQVVFTVPATPVTATTAWSRSPSWDEGTIDAPSWVFRCGRNELRDVTGRLQALGAPTRHGADNGEHLERLFALDPMGKTVEVYWEGEPAG